MEEKLNSYPHQMDLKFNVSGYLQIKDIKKDMVLKYTPLRQ